MNIKRSILLALIASAAIAPTAFAQAGDDTASGKHFAVIGGGMLLQNTNGFGGDTVKGGGVPTLSLNYMINDNWTVELWGAADKINHKAPANGSPSGTYAEMPIALSGQYHFGQADDAFRPFVGAGYYQSNFSNEKLAVVGAPAGHVGIKTAQGAIATVGVDMNINAHWFVRADARYMYSKPNLTIAGEEVAGKVRADAWTVGFGIGARF